jgi:hypothetical protein
MSQTARRPGLRDQPKAVWAVLGACIVAFMRIGLVDPILPITTGAPLFVASGAVAIGVLMLLGFRVLLDGAGAAAAAA